MIVVKVFRMVAVTLLAVGLGIQVWASTTVDAVAQILAESNLPVKRLDGRRDTWYVTYTGLENWNELDAYVWARKSGYVTVYVTPFILKNDPPKAFLRRLLEINGMMMTFKYCLRDERGMHLVDCQADLAHDSLNSAALRGYLEDLVLMADKNHKELNNLL